jgi:uncharacterized protein (UPF0548 family)
MAGRPTEDASPPLPSDVDTTEVQTLEEGVGPMVHRLYRVRVRTAQMGPEELMEQVTADLDAVAPSEFASFQKVNGEKGRLRVGDEYVVRMPGPWDGPVRVVARAPASFRFATLEGHLEAGQIEFSVERSNGSLVFAIESWARSGDRFSDLAYSRLRMAKEVQLHMWMTVLERVVDLTRGRRDGGIVVTTRLVEVEDRKRGPLARRGERRARCLLERLPSRELNFDPSRAAEYTPENRWHVDEARQPLPAEPPGEPVPGGSWEIARRLMTDYQVAEPRMVRATYRPGSELAGRDMVLQVRFAVLRLYVGVRGGEVYDEVRTEGSREARVFGWNYRTLEGHFEQGQLTYEVWKWLDTGEVEFRLHGYSRVADSGPLITRLGFRLFGRTRQLRFYREACRRMRRQTESQKEVETAWPQRIEPTGA